MGTVSLVGRQTFEFRAVFMGWHERGGVFHARFLLPDHRGEMPDWAGYTSTLWFMGSSLPPCTCRLEPCGKTASGGTAYSLLALCALPPAWPGLLDTMLTEAL